MRAASVTVEVEHIGGLWPWERRRRREVARGLDLFRSVSYLLSRIDCFVWVKGREG